MGRCLRGSDGSHGPDSHLWGTRYAGYDNVYWNVSSNRKGRGLVWTEETQSSRDSHMRRGSCKDLVDSEGLIEGNEHQ